MADSPIIDSGAMSMVVPMAVQHAPLVSSPGAAPSFDAINARVFNSDFTCACTGPAIGTVIVGLRTAGEGERVREREREAGPEPPRLLGMSSHLPVR